MATESNSGTAGSTLQRTILGVLIVVTWLVAMSVLGQDGGTVTLIVSVMVTVLAVGGVAGLVMEGIREGQNE